MPDLEKLWDELNQQPVHRFADWPNKEVPKGKPGVYLIYQEGRWIYIGMSFKNLQGRLSQASGRRSGDQFICGGSVGHAQAGIDQMKGAIDQRIRPFSIFFVVADDPTARALEKHGLEIAEGQGAIFKRH